MTSGRLPSDNALAPAAAHGHWTIKLEWGMNKGGCLLVLAVLLLSSGQAHAETMGVEKDMSSLQSVPLESGHAPINGIDMYYEVHGRRDGVPLVLRLSSETRTS